MSFAKSSVTALGRLFVLALVVGAFIVGLAGVVYMSLQGNEIKVPEITGKDYSASEQELAQLGLKIKKRADRPSPDAPNTIIEQLPKPGETVKTGQMILVVTSKGPGDTDVKPPSLKNDTDEDDTEKIEEMISDKPKKAKSNSNTKKKPDTSRDVNANSAETNSNSGSNSNSSNSNKKEGNSNNNSTEKPKDHEKPAANKPATTTKPPGESKPKQVIKP